MPSVAEIWTALSNEMDIELQKFFEYSSETRIFLIFVHFLLKLLVLAKAQLNNCTKNKHYFIKYKHKFK